ncbi:DNA alkylation repair protein [Lacticaseibacillus baoqingensis]|uniref:DNA alkylation repair protein n=1 Tax=Lacticaseibacillus baoqingensis TaxID=2486013 RepID=A0ABW4ECC6_9LACO|nr:DNA alkylation repair protein [Lacticaseibacillus baoqingensis]
MLTFTLYGDAATAQAMAKYMRNQFPFVGLKTPQRKAQTKPLLQASRTWSTPDVLAAVQTLYARPQREYQYAAIELAREHVRDYDLDNLRLLAALVTKKAWWDTVDSLRPLFWDYWCLHPVDRPCLWGWFYGQADFWLRRVAITLQLQAKAQTDLTLLTQAIDADLTTPEFFIQKAIGWALRQYSKTDPDWVRAFITTRPQMTKLAVREGSKYLV